MKLYSNAMAPSPRRIVLALAEKGLTDVEIVNVELAKGEQFHPDFVKRNPLAKVPVLELDDGTCISEAGAIYRYLEETRPEPNLLGRSAVEKAQIEMWDRHVENAFFTPLGLCFVHASGVFDKHRQTFPEFGKASLEEARKFLAIMEQQLSQHEYLAGDRFSVADITALCTLEFARAVHLRVDDEYPSILRWHERMKQRPSYGSGLSK